MLKAVGYSGIFLPKSFPQKHNFRSASVDYSEDQFLGLPDDVVSLLNAQNWYSPVARDVWNVVNEYFEVAFFIAQNFDAVENLLRHFKGQAIWRAYGLDRSLSYSSLIGPHHGATLAADRASRRLWLGEAYSNIHDIEGTLLRRQAVWLPLGLADTGIADRWTGADRRIFFICPEIATNYYYRAIYEDFKTHFGDLPHAIGGAQPIAVTDPNVLGFVPAEQHAQNMREMRVMFYHSTEPRHVHYHPFEAIRAGMPLIYMAGGLLDALGGNKPLPGRARDSKHARSLLRAILDGDSGLIQSIRTSQAVLLEPMKAENCLPQWQAAFETIGKAIKTEKAIVPVVRRRRIAVLLPVGYRGGTLRGAKLLMQALLEGSALAGESVEVVFGHLDDPSVYSDEDFRMLPKEVVRRPYKWRRIGPDEAKRTMSLAGYPSWEPSAGEYMLPNDGIRHFFDCDLWVVISDRIEVRPLPLRPIVAMVFDYLQRYVRLFDTDGDAEFLQFANEAVRVLVTTEATARDAVQYAGVPSSRLSVVPMIVPRVEAPPPTRSGEQRRYFVWPTNLGPHKNHENALKALAAYYRVHGGKYDCLMTGVNTGRMLEDADGRDIAPVMASGKDAKAGLRVRGELSDAEYFRLVADASFLWHPALYDNGTFAVIEAAQLGVRSVVSSYPAMHEIDRNFRLDLAFFDPRNVDEMARRLKEMEDARPDPELAARTIGKVDDRAASARAYWAVIREWL
jgi:glycosyltransferase involved in cell wall biosynthesis